VRGPSTAPGSGSLEIESPVEFLVEGVPLSLQSSRASLRAWKAAVRQAATGEREGSAWTLQGPIHVTIYYFPADRMLGDLDNIVKPILDAMSAAIYGDDGQVERLLVEKFEPERTFTVETRSATLASALERERPLLYVRVDDERTSRESVA
jgi:crossover junction endodeoxyribonuclease RusA